MTPNDFRQLVLSFADARAVTVLGGEEFWIDRAVIASVGSPDHRFAVIKLSRDDQAAVVASAPLVFTPAPGGAGQRGATQVRLANAESDQVRLALKAACDKVAQVAPPRGRSRLS